MAKFETKNLITGEVSYHEYNLPVAPTFNPNLLKDNEEVSKKIVEWAKKGLKNEVRMV